LNHFYTINKLKLNIIILAKSYFCNTVFMLMDASSSISIAAFIVDDEPPFIK